MTQEDVLSINTVAAKLGLSVHQLRRWELMFGLEIKRGRGQQRQYRSEDLLVLERIKELVEQGWPTSQIRPQIEGEGLITPKLIGVPQQSGSPEMIMESVIGLRNFTERRFTEISRQLDELKQLMISVTLKSELRSEISAPWQPVEDEHAPASHEPGSDEITIVRTVHVDMVSVPEFVPDAGSGRSFPVPDELAPIGITLPPFNEQDDLLVEEDELLAEESESVLDEEDEECQEDEDSAAPSTALSAKLLERGLQELTDRNFLDVLGKLLDKISWSDEQADQYSEKEFGIEHWDELERSRAEMLIAYLLAQMDINPEESSD